MSTVVKDAHCGKGGKRSRRAVSGGNENDSMQEDLFDMVGNAKSSTDGIVAVKRGLRIHALDRLQAELGIASPAMLKVVGISSSTLRRRRTAGRLDQYESERVYRLGKVFYLASEVLGSRELAVDWFKSANTALGGAIPLEYADTEIGKQEIEKLLYRIAYGVIS